MALPGLPAERDGTVVAFVSDLHIGPHLDRGWVERRVRDVLALKPDVILVGGDVFEGDVDDAGGHLSAVRALRAPLGVWAVTGNHDGYGRRHDRPPMERVGWGILRNAWREVAPGLVIAGVDDLSFRPAAVRDASLAAALADLPPSAGVLLVSHAPVGADRAARAGVGLMVSGHTHDGQIWPFGYVVRRFFPMMAGRYDVEGLTVIVSRGLGTWGPRMRLWRRGEIVRITLRTAPGNRR